MKDNAGDSILEGRRQVVGPRCCEIVPDVEIGVSADVWLRVIHRTVIERMAKRIGSQSRQPTTKPALKLNLKSIVVRSNTVWEEINRERKIRIDRGHVDLVYLEQ